MVFPPVLDIYSLHEHFKTVEVNMQFQMGKEKPQTHERWAREFCDCCRKILVSNVCVSQRENLIIKKDCVVVSLLTV